MPFFDTANEYFAVLVSVSSAAHKTCALLDINKLSISKAFPVKMNDVPHLQRL